MTLSELNVAIIKWAEDRQILKHSSAYAQAFKTAEEVMELVEAAAKHSTGSVPGHNDYSDEIRDALGDIYVTLVVGGRCYRGEYIDAQGNHMAASVKDPVLQLQKSLITLGAASKGQGSYWLTQAVMASCLTQIAEKYGTTLEACVNQAYNAIKDRKGHLNAQGIFVKEET